MKESRPAWHEFDGTGPDVDQDGNEARTEDDPDLTAAKYR